MSIRDDILAGLRIAEADSVGDETPEELLDAYRVEVLAGEDDTLARLDRELRGRIEHEKAGKARWRARAEKAEARVAELEAALALDPDPIAYGPRGYRCGCGKDAHSNLAPCAPEGGESR